MVDFPPCHTVFPQHSQTCRSSEKGSMERMLQYLNRKGQVLLSCYAGKHSVEFPEFHMKLMFSAQAFVFFPSN